MKSKHSLGLGTIIATTCLFFASFNVAMADACSQKQLDDGCKNKTSSTGYKWCDCPAKSFQKGKQGRIGGATTIEPGSGGMGNPNLQPDTISK